MKLKVENKKQYMKLKKNKSLVLSTNGTVVVIGNKIDVMTDITFLIDRLLETLPQNVQKYILAALIGHLKNNNNEISDEDEELAQKVLDKIKELK